MPVHPPSPRPLDGHAVIVTRPDARVLLRAARALGAEALRLPGLALRARAFDWPEAVDDWIFISPAAVRFALARGVPPAIARSRVFAIGPGSRAALARRGIVARMPDAGADSEGLLALPALADVRARRIALVGAPGGRDLIGPALAARGADVVHVHAYERAPPRWTRRHLDALARSRPPWIVLVSSGEALANIVAAAAPDLLRRLREARLVVSSARLARLARTHGFERIAIAASAAPRDLIAAARDDR